jgi:hypothetical protein
VEFWFRSSPVNRHKWPPRSSSTRIYNWIWANVYQRTANDTMKDVERVLSIAVRW